LNWLSLVKLAAAAHVREAVVLVLLLQVFQQNGVAGLVHPMLIQVNIRAELEVVLCGVAVAAALVLAQMAQVVLAVLVVLLAYGKLAEAAQAALRLV
jgi:hypothetical protein